MIPAGQARRLVELVTAAEFRDGLDNWRAAYRAAESLRQMLGERIGFERMVNEPKEARACTTSAHESLPPRALL
jgi:hypothetical protein